MAAIQNLNKLKFDYEEFVNTVVKDVTEENLFWSDEDKRLSYNRWLTIHAEQLKKLSSSHRAPHLGAFAENDTVPVDDEKKQRLNELLVVSDSQIIETTKRRKRCPLKCAQYLAKQCKYECTFVERQKAVLRKNVSSTAVSSAVIRRRATAAVKATNNAVKSLVELSKATTKYALLHSELVLAKKFTATKTAPHSLLPMRDAQTTGPGSAPGSLSTDNAEHHLGKSSVTLKTVECNLLGTHRGYRKPLGTIL